MGGNNAKNASLHKVLGAWYEYTMPNVNVKIGNGNVSTPILIINYNIISVYVK